MNAGTVTTTPTSRELLTNARHMPTGDLAAWVRRFAMSQPDDADWALLIEIGYRLNELAARDV